MTREANSQNFTTLHSFSTNEGSQPLMGLTSVSNVLYGTTPTGGAFQSGAVFSMHTDGTSFKVLHSFTATQTNLSGIATNSDGQQPQAEVTVWNGTIYGTTLRGGTLGSGVLFGAPTDGSGFTNLYNFDSGSANLHGKLAINQNVFYGTSDVGGTAGKGSVFQINPDGTGFSNVVSLTNISAEGSQPMGDLIAGGNQLYGTARVGGQAGNGTVFRETVDGSEFGMLHSFGVSGPNSNGYLTNSDGVFPNPGLVLIGNKLYGTTRLGGTSTGGTVFSVGTDGTDFTILHMFTGSNEGSSPYSGLILRGQTLYGTTAQGGTDNSGTLFGLNIDGTGFTNLYIFPGALGGAGTNLNGSYPEGILCCSGDTLYGTTMHGGTNGQGVIFSYTLPPLPPLTLSILSSGANVTLTPNPESIGALLESTTNLSTSPQWTVIATNTGQFPLTLSIVPPSSTFFRLRSQ